MVTAVGSTKVNVARFRGRDLNAMAYGSRIIWRKDVAATFTVTLSVNPSDISRVKSVKATGDVIKSEVAKDQSVYIFTIQKGGTATVSIQSKVGFEPVRINVDKENKGPISEYTFTNVISDHTMYLWMQAAVVNNPTDWLERSDKIGVFYSDYTSAFNSLKEDYPSGLTEDVTLSCVKVVTYLRIHALGRYMATLSEFNRDTPYTLTIDGCSMLTLNCDGLSGFSFYDTDNIILRTIKFVNFANLVNYYVPEESSAVQFEGSTVRNARNLYIEDCDFDGLFIGQSDRENTRSEYTIISKRSDNVTLQGCRFVNNKLIAINMKWAYSVFIKSCTFSGKEQAGMIGHPAVMSFVTANIVIIEDCDINATGFKEHCIVSSGVSNIILRRNTAYGGSSRFCLSEHILGLDAFIVEYNIIYGFINDVYGAWTNSIMAIGSAKRVKVTNNTILLNGSYPVQKGLKGGAVDDLEFCNNVIINHTATGASPLQLAKAKSIRSFNNVFKNITGAYMEIDNTLNDPDYPVVIKGGNRYNLSLIQALGYDVGSKLLKLEDELIDLDRAVEHGYGIISSLIPQYLAKSEYVSEFDCGYRKNGSIIPAGAINNMASVFNEMLDNTVGFEGHNLTEDDDFSSEAVYSTYSDSLLMITHKSKNRRKFIRGKIVGSNAARLLLSKYSTIGIVSNLDSNGDYKNAQNYRVEYE